jgi:FkbM family methyltransferase
MTSKPRKKGKDQKKEEGALYSGRTMNLVAALKYSIFVIRYFKHPLKILLTYVKKHTNTIVELRKGGVFNSFGYGDVGLGLYRIWGVCEYGIRPKDAKKFRVVVDIGAHIGYFSVFLGVLNPKCHVLSYEIDKGNFEKLKQNINNCGALNVIPIHSAVTDKCGFVNYFSGRDCSEFSTTKISFSNSATIVNEGLIAVGTVNSITLNDVIEGNNLDYVDFLKLDCEGAEFEILYSTTKENFKKIKAIGGEYHEYGRQTVHELIDYLSTSGHSKHIEERSGIGLIHYTKN